jgi:hypothetical protein
VQLSSGFAARIGVSEGKGIIYKDANDNYNVAGVAMNLASRVMGLADGMQILLSAEAYQNLIDMTNEVRLEDDFTQFKDIEVKHGAKLDVYQYRPKEAPSINGTPPEYLVLSQQMSEMRSLIPGLGLTEVTPAVLGPKIEALKKLFGILKDAEGLVDSSRASSPHPFIERPNRPEE